MLHTIPTESVDPRVEVPLFLFDQRSSDEVLRRLKSAGLDYNNPDFFIAHDSLTCDCPDGVFYLKTQGTLLRAHVIHCLKEDSYIYQLSYLDTIICESKISQKTRWHNNVEFSEKNLDILPKSLIKNREILEEKKVENNNNIYLPVGKNLPDPIQMKHLSYLGISSKNFIFDEQKNTYFLKLPKDGKFSHRMKYNLKPWDSDLRSNHYTEVYDLQYNDTTIMKTYNNPVENECRMDFEDFTAIARATGKISNIIEVPSKCYTDLWRTKLMAEGTIESCIDGIKKDIFAGFSLGYRYQCEDLAERFHYNIFDHAKTRLLIDALQDNNRLEKLELSNISLSKEDFLDLLDALKKIKTFKCLDLPGAKIEISLEDMPEVIKAIEGISITDRRSTTTYWPSVYLLPIDSNDHNEFIKQSKTKIEQLAFKDGIFFLTNLSYSDFCQIKVENGAIVVEDGRCLLNREKEIFTLQNQFSHNALSNDECRDLLFPSGWKRSQSEVRRFLAQLKKNPLFDPHIPLEKQVQKQTLVSLMTELDCKPVKDECRKLTYDQINILYSYIRQYFSFKSLDELTQDYKKTHSLTSDDTILNDSMGIQKLKVLRSK